MSSEPAIRADASMPYFAFVSGALTYDCKPCGRCCRGLGFADPPGHFIASARLRTIAAFASDTAPQEPLQSFFTYADGCRFMTSDDACSLQRDAGAAAKPLICRLYPFARMVVLDEVPAVLPNSECPWTASGTTSAPASQHDEIRTLLQGIVADSNPRVLRPVTRLEPSERLRLEQALRNDVGLQPGFKGGYTKVLERQAAIQSELIPTAAACSPPIELWLDLLRCAGMPPRLSRANETLLLAAFPTLRILLSEVVALPLIPVALSAFALWLRALLGELRESNITGADVLHLFSVARPLLKVMSMAELPISELPALPAQADSPAMVGCTERTWQALRHAQGAPLGETLLRTLRGHAHGSLHELFALGEFLPPQAPEA